jgi:alkylated DNA repair dioxygenase AlkB
MPIFDNELIDNVSDRNSYVPNMPLGSPITREVDTSLNLFEGDQGEQHGLTWDQIGEIQAPEQRSFDKPFSSVSRGELLANKRYPMYERDVDLENIYGLQQSWYNKLGNSLVKTGIRAVGTFAQGLADIPNIIDAARKTDISQLSGDVDGYEGTIDNWINNMENVIPNYMSREEKEHPYLAMIPFAPGSANFWGESVLKNLGFTAGAIASAAVQDLAIGAITGGIGEIPLLAEQIGKVALRLNKIAGGANKVDKVLDIARAAGKSEEFLLKVEKMGQLAQATKVLNGARYGIITWGASQTEAGVESREGYVKVKEELIQQYKDNNFGEEPTGSALNEIENYATDAMNTRFGINMALLTVSNAVQFDNLFKSFIKAEKGVSGGILTKSIEDAGKIGLKKGSLDEFEKKTAASLSGRIWDSVKPKLVNVLAEGVYEEGGQYAAEKGTYNYYTRKYKDLSNPNNKKNWDDLKEIVNSTTFGMAEQFGSSEGIQNMLVGGITAMLTGTAQSLYDSKTGKGKDARLQSSINILNRFGMTGILSNKYDNTLNSISIAKEMDEAAKGGNVFKYKNLKHNMFFNFVQSRIPSGMHDVTIEQLNMLKDLSKEDFEKSFGMDFNSSNQKTVSGYIDSLIAKANDIKKTSDSVDFTFKNPFQSIIDPKTPEEDKIVNNHKTFEEWKTNLKYYATIKDDVNQRLDSIEQKVIAINPLVNNDVLSKLTDRDSLIELSKQYEEQANQLNKTITDYTTPTDKKATRDQVKALRTASEKITIALNSNDLDLKTFNSLLNFELNNQNPKKDDVIGLENATELYTYGADINKNNIHKKVANNSFDNLSTEEGFNKFFKQAEDVNKETIDIDYEEVAPTPTIINKEKVKEPLEVNREYEIKTTKKASIKKLADDRYQVTSPDGTVSFHKTKEAAEEEAKDLTTENTNLSKVKVIALNDDGTVKVEDVNGDILNIDPKRLQGYSKITTPEEKLAKDKETLDRELEQLSPTGGSVETIPTPPNEFVGSTDKRKDVDIVFLSTTSPSEDTAGEAVNNLPHIVRAKTFLNNFKFFTNRNKIKTILVTSNNAEELGLNGIVQLSYDKQLTDSLTEEETDVNNGFMAQVFIVQTPEGDFFVNEKGEKLSKVGPGNPTILNDVVFQTMTSASLYTEGGYEKIRKGQEEQAERALEAYKLFRKDVFAQKGYTPYSFSISRGIPRQYVVNGVYENNYMSDILGPNADRIIAEHNGLITVVTTGTHDHNGELLSFPVGTTLIQYGDLLDFANNKQLTNKQANNIFAVINAMAKDLIAKSNTSKAGKPDYNYLTFLKNVLYWKFKGETTTPSQISIDTKTMEFRIGTKAFPFSKVEESKKEIMDILQDAFISVNNKTLTEEKTSKEFTEYVVDKDGTLKPVVWKNYQSFLLANKNPDGSSRSVEETPLITHTSKPTDSSPSYKQKYSYITDKDVLPYDRVPVKEAKPAPVTPVAKQLNKIGEYSVNEGKEETFSVASGPVLFTATLSPEGEVNVEIKDNDTTRDLSTNQSKIDYIDKVLTKDLSPEEIEVYNQKLNEDKVSLFLSTAIKQSLETEYQKEQTTPAIPEEVYEAFTEEAEESRQQSIELEQQDIEAKKADIERRRQESLNAIKQRPNETLFTAPYYKKGYNFKQLPTDSAMRTEAEEKEYYEILKNNNALTDVSIQVKTREEAEKLINDKYDAELAALEGNVLKINQTEKGDIRIPTEEGSRRVYINSPEFKEVVEQLSEKQIEKWKNWLKGELADIPNRIEKETKRSSKDYQGSNSGLKAIRQTEQDYKNTLAALETTSSTDAPYDPSKKKRRGDVPEYRQIGKDSSDRMTNSELEIFKQWHTKNVPFIPFEILENIIKRGDIKAWGVFEDGVAKFVRGGLRGTEYHEIFEAIYADFLTETEKNDLITEFRNKKGEFIDRQSGKKIAYIDATDKQAKERIADDFADFRLGKLPSRSLGEAVRNLFKKIMDFFKSFVSKPSMKNELFKAIDSGKFKETKLSERAKTLAPEYRAIEGLTEEQTNNYINDMVFQVSRIIFREGNKDSLFNPEKLTGNQVFDKVRAEYESLGEIDALGEKRYNELVKRTIESIRTRGISFNAEEVVSINDENANGKEYAQDTFSVDWKKHSTGALKFLLSTLAERKALNQTNVEKGTPLQPAKYNLSNEGYKLLNFNRVFSTLLDRLHGTNDVNVFADKFIQLAKEDSNYLPLFISLGGNPITHTFDFENFGVDTDWRLFIQFFNTFTRQKPDALIQYTNEEGDVYTGSANIFTTVKQTVDSWVDNMKVLGKAPGGLISFDKKVYKIDTAAIKALSIKKSTDMLNFLNKIGVEFTPGTYEALSNKDIIVQGKQTSEIKEFTDAVGKIHAYLGKNNELMTFDAKRLDISGPLRTLATLYTKVNNPNQDSTYFGVEGQRIGAFSENNAPSYFENTFNESETLDELLEKMPQLNDVYSRGSEILKPGGLFFDENRKRIATISVGYIQGSKNEITGKDKSTAKLSKGERFVQEMNQNINGNYYVLIPGDSSTEWMMNLGNVISMEDVISGKHWNKVYSIYSNYLNDDINLALADRKQNLYQRPKSQELRIMRDILPQDIVEDIEEMIQDETSTYDDIQDYINKNREDINKSVKDFIEGMSKETFDILLDSNQVTMVGEDGYTISKFNTDFLKKYNLTGKVSLNEVMNLINFTNINYVINNQEYHKILFGDPYQFKTEKGKLDETKRIKSFLSGRRRTFDHPAYNNKLKEVYNVVDGIDLEEGTPGYHEYKEYTNTVTFNDVKLVGSIATLPNVPQELKDAYAVDKDGNGKVNETDAMSWLMDNTHKEIALKEGQWSNEAEAFHQWHMAYTRQAFLKKDLFKTKELKEAYENSPLNKKDAALILKPIPKYKLAIRKPIVSGNKANKTEIDLVLDKTSQMPLYYHMVEDTSLENIYIQMFEQNVGYGIVISGRKVGAEGVHDIYVEGKVNTAKFENIVEVPWKIYGTQVETMSEGEKEQTRGSQLTKMSTMDLYENGEPIGVTPERKEVIRKAVKRHDGALDMLNENAYNGLLDKLGVTDLGDGYALEDKQRISETLMYEMMRRELSENAKDTIQLEDGEFIMPFEASPSYTQIKSILYSMVNKALISPAMNGAPHVQVPVTMFEKATEGRSFARKVDGKWVKITKAQYSALSEEEKKGVMLTDDTLKFYEDEDGKRYCQILLPHWFKNKFGNMTDEQILKYLNTPEGQKILTGIGFRIPTQALSSVEVFRVKGFLPQYMGYTVVVPSEITTKAGSDFDIDKLNIYLKSVYTDRNGNVKLVKWLGTEQSTKDFFTKVYDEKISKNYINLLNIIEIKENRNNFFELVNKLENDEPLSEIDKKFYDEHSEVIDLLFDMSDKAETPIVTYVLDYFKNIDNIQESLIKSNNVVLKQQYVNNMYKKALENEYYDSLEELLTLPENFIKLITPVDDAGLEKISELLDSKRGYNESNIKGRLVNRNFMTNMRHAFITGKRWVGIAAVNITNLSLRQKSKVYLDSYLDIILPHNTLTDEGKTYVSLSGTKTADGEQLISNRLSGYATAFVDIANKPFITKIIKSDVVVSTFMFLESIGAGNTGIYFLNQPIIEKYLEYLDSIGSKSVTGKKNLEYIRNQFPTTDDAIKKTSISVDQLLDNIQEYGENGKFDQLKNAEQQLILNEFIKYKILADQLFSYTQATNYDTTRFGSSDALLKKEWATFNVSNFNLISNVDDVLKNTFIGKQADLLSKSFASFGAIMKTELPEIKAYTISTLKKYATRKYMSMDDYEKIANLIKNSFVDYVIQNNTTISNMIKPLLVDSETAVVNQLEQAKQKYPDVQILKDLIPVLGNREGSAKSIQLKANVKDAYSENLYVGMMRELRDANPELNALYNNIVNVAILQGTGQSAISIRNIIPVEDYAAKIAPIINNLQPTSSLDAFENGMFERNNFANSDVFTEFSPYFMESYTTVTDPNTGEELTSYYFPNFQAMKGASKASRRLITLSDVYNSFQLSSDFLKIPKVVTNNKGMKINLTTGLEVTPKDYALMKQKGSQDLYNSYYYKKVYTKNKDKFGNPIPLMRYNKDINGYDYYYKLINVYGDGNRAVEFNTDFTRSVIDNGSISTPLELSDDDIVNAFAPQIAEEVVPLPEETPTQVTEQPKGVKVKEGIYVNQEALSKDEQLELFDYLKPFLEEQAAKTNKGEAASKMIGLGLRWDYKSNNTGKQAMNIPDVINPGNKTKYGYYNSSINNQPLAPITPRFRELMQKATGVDMTNYDGAIINLYEPNSFISSHNDVDESRSAIGYPVIGINIGGTGNFSIESRDGAPKQLNLQPGAGYVFGVDGVNREVYHRTFAKPQDSFLPELTTKIDGKTYEPGSYRITVTMRRVMPLEPGMPSKPAITSTETVSEQVGNVQVVDRYSIADVQANSNKIYIFGDNVIEKGKGGQAIIRDEENAFGIPTKVLPDTTPNSYFNDNKYEANSSQIDRAIEKIKNDGRPVVFPKDGLGTGLAKLKEKAPQTYTYLKQRLLEEFGFDNDKGTIAEQVVQPGEQLGLFGNTIMLKDGKEYSKSEINSEMLGAMGYTPKEIGKILKSIC